MLICTSCIFLFFYLCANISDVQIFEFLNSKNSDIEGSFKSITEPTDSRGWVRESWLARVILILGALWELYWLLGVSCVWTCHIILFNWYLSDGQLHCLQSFAIKFSLYCGYAFMSIIYMWWLGSIAIEFQGQRTCFDCNWKGGSFKTTKIVELSIFFTSSLTLG